MAENDVTPEEIERQKQRRRAAMATPVADEGDVAFGGMVGVALLAAILAAMFAFFGFAGGGTLAAEPTEVDEVAEAEAEPDIPEILGLLAGSGFDSIQLSSVPVGIVTARGEVADDDARAEVLAIISDQSNVSQVIDELTLAQVQEPEPEAAAATVAATTDGIVLSGTVPSEQAADALRALVAESYSADQITDELEIVDGADPATVTLTGTVTDSAVGGALQSGLGGLAGFTDSTDRLEIQADASEEINAILELEPILFQSGTAIILPDSQPTIDEAVRILNLFPDTNVEIGGHTDSLGPDEANRILSEARAQAVLQALRNGGVTNQLSAVGFGESQLKFPDDKGDTQDKIDARQANRRIEFTTLN